jgi:hypothetical protein
MQKADVEAGSNKLAELPSAAQIKALRNLIHKILRPSLLFVLLKKQRARWKIFLSIKGDRYRIFC